MTMTIAVDVNTSMATAKDRSVATISSMKTEFDRVHLAMLAP